MDTKNAAGDEVVPGENRQIQSAGSVDGGRTRMRRRIYNNCASRGSCHQR
jgi:hypothetical protein